ncbi:translation initiation factor IF-2 isoform X2 [Triticum aestivum]|uniref:translation initiation factor IF-2 isoform X2 n=1 Tax=Triticum aestivum TaxID=4565 RepID=UPI001D00EEB1|nr:translation initiation factor IF-2-like isoform X2 [Triticum aestivum]
MARGGAHVVAAAALLLLLLLAAGGGGVHCLRGGERRHGPGAAAPRQLRPRRQEQQGGGGPRRPGLRRRQGLVAAAAHRQLRADQVVGRGVQAGAGPRHLRRHAPDAQLRRHHGHRRRRGHGDRGHGERAHLGAVQAVRRLPRPAGAALRPVGVAVLRRRAVQLLLLRRAAGGHRDVRPGLRPARDLQLRPQLPRRVLLPRRAGARQAEPGRREHRGLRVRLRHQQPGPVRRHVRADGARPEPALAHIPNHGAVRRRVLLLPAAEGVRLVGVPRPRRRLLGVPELHPDRVHRDGLRPAAGALLHGQPDRDHRGRRGGAVPGVLGRRRRQGHRRLRHDHHEPGAVRVRGGAGRVPEPAGGVPAGAALLHPGHLLRPDGAEGGAGAEPEAGVRRRRGGGGGLQGRALRSQRRRLPGVPSAGRPQVRGRHPDHRQLPAEEPEGDFRHRGVSDRVRARDL